MGNNAELLLLGLSRALDTGVQTALRRQEENRRYQLDEQRQQEQMIRWALSQKAAQSRFDTRQKGIQSRHEDRMAAETARANAKGGPFDQEDAFSKLQGTPGALEAMTELFSQRFPSPEQPGPSQPGPPRSLESFSADELQQYLDYFVKQNPVEVPLELQHVDEMRRLEEEGLPLHLRNAAAMDAVKKREREIQDIKGRKRDTQKVKNFLQEAIRKLKGQSAQQGTGAVSPAGQSGAGRGGDGGAGMAGYAPPRMPALDPQLVSQLPQGAGAGPNDQVQLGMIAKHFNTAMELHPGGASATEMAQAWQWLAENLPIGPMPLQVELMAQGVPGAPTPRGMPAVRDLLG